jgi:hypothetical protein
MLLVEYTAGAVGKYHRAGLRRFVWAADRKNLRLAPNAAIEGGEHDLREILYRLQNFDFLAFVKLCHLEAARYMHIPKTPKIARMVAMDMAAASRNKEK